MTWKYSYVDSWDLMPLPYLDSADALSEVRKWVNDFLRYNGAEGYQGCLTYRQTGEGSAVVGADDTHYFIVPSYSYCNMKNPDERRMYVWRLVCDVNLIDACRQAVIERLEAGACEYEEILAAQDLGV
jgi:hypothetical protein